MRMNHSLTAIPSRFATVGILCTGAVLLLVASASAQLPQNRLYALFPAGGQAGTKLDVTITNSADADEVQGLHFSQPGITAVQKTQIVNGRREPVANQFTVKIDKDVPPGIYDVRSVGLFGISNPRSFVVGSRKELQEAEGNNTPETATALELQTVTNARCGSAGDIDFYKFSGKKGDRLIIDCRARRIDSRMEATLELYDPNKRRIAFSRSEVRGDPLIDVKLPADGEYMIRVYDFLYGGSNDHFYRLAVHSGAHVDFVMPPAAVAGSTAEYTLYGSNLPGGEPSGIKIRDRELDRLKVKIAAPADSTALQPGMFLSPYEASLDGFVYRLQTPQGPANPILIQFASSACQLEQEPNNAGPQANKITVPGEVAGQFQSRGDIDYFQFEAKDKSVYWIEVFGQRSGNSADPHLIVEQITVGKDGKETVKRLTAQDDVGTNLGAQGFDTRSDDPVFRFDAPADGTYRIMLRDRYFESRGDPRLVYRVSIQPKKPDYRLVALPRQPVLANNAAALPATWDLSLRKGDHTEIEVMAFRKHGFNDIIDVTVAGLPAGVTCPGATLGPGQSTARLILTSSEDAAEWVGPIQIVGKVRIDDPAALKAERDSRTKLDAANNALPALQTAADAAAAAEKAAKEKVAAQAKSAETAVAKSKQAADTAAELKKQLATAETGLKTAQQQAVQAAMALEASSTKFVNAAVAKATADRQVDETAAVMENAVAAKLAAQEAKDAAAEAAADKQIIAAAVAAKLARDAKSTAATQFETAVTEKQQATTQKAAADKQAVAAKTAHQKLAEQYAAAEKASQEAAAVAKKETDAKAASDKALSAAAEQLKKATAAIAEGKKQAAAANTAWSSAQQQRDAKRQDLTRVARGGTIVWSGNQTLTAQSRLSRNIALAVLAESAPFQISSGVNAIEVSQGAQILVPVKLAKRGFDNKVDLVFEAVPKNFQVEKKAIEKGKAESLLKVFVKNNVKPGKYTLYLRGQGQISYSRNPDAAKAAEAAKQEAVKQAAQAAEAVKKTTAAKQAADKAAAEAQAAATKAGEAFVAADVAVVAAQKAVEAATADKQKAEQSETDDAAKQAAAKKLADAQAALKAAQDNRAAAEKQAQAAAAAFKQKQTVKNDTDRAAAEAAAKAKTAEAIKKAAEAKAAATAKAAKPANRNVFTPSGAITVTVKPAAATLKSSLPNKGALKRGTEFKATVTVNRKNGFAGPVTLSLPIPPGVKGLSAIPVVVPADKKQGVLVIKAAGDATEGKLANLVIRASMNFDGATAVDVPVTITVNK